MDRKTYLGPLELKAGDAAGAFRATFATLNTVDRDGDVTTPGAFKAGQPVRIARWGHNWGDLPVGKGVIHANQERAWVDGHFFLDTQAGLDTYRTVKNLGALQEWSYGFEIKEHSFGQHSERDVRFLRALDVFEVSPVMLGAGVGTHTDSIKAVSPADAVEPPPSAATPPVEAKAGRRLSAASISRIRAAMDTLHELFGEMPAAADMDVDEAAAAQGDTEEKAAPLSLADAGNRLVADLAAYAARLNDASDEEASAVREYAADALKRVAAVQKALDGVLARANASGPTTADVRRQFMELERRLGLAERTATSA